MKRFLSIFLALTMILAMMPTTFAAVDAETGAITYVFSRDVYNSSNNIFKAGLATKTFSDILSEKSAPWRAVGQRYILNMYSGENGLYYYSQTSRTSGSGCVGIELKVTDGGLYTPSITYTAKKSAPVVGVYLVKEGTSVVYDGKTYSTAGIAGLVDSDGEASSNGDVHIYHLINNLPETYKLGTVNMYEDTETTKTTTFSSLNLDKNSKYYLLIRAEGWDEFKNEAVTLSDRSCFEVTLQSFDLKLEKLDKTHEYIFNQSVLTGDIVNNAAFTKDYRMFYIPEGKTQYIGNYLDSYDNLNSSCTDLWTTSILGGAITSTGYKYTSSLEKNYLQMIGRRRLNNGANSDANFVLKLNVKHDAIYKVTADVEASTNGTQADIYMLTADGTITDINSEMLKNYNSIGRVSSVVNEVDGDVGTVKLTKGDWYIVFAFNSTNANSANGNKQNFSLKSITLTETDSLQESGATPEDVESEDVPEISFSATTNIPDKAVVTINGNEGNLQVLDPSRGDEIRVKAPEIEGYRFIGWKSGTAEKNGEEVKELANTAKFVQDLEQEDTFTVYTSTFLTAVYEETEPAESTASIVEFWNLDGSYLGSKTVDKIKEEEGFPTTSLIGHTFMGWKTDEETFLDIDAINTIVEKITHAVADYTADATVDPANHNGVRVNGETLSEVNTYGKEVICEDDGDGTVTHWLRDGKVVSYDPTYKYYVWDTTNISSSYAPIDKKPLVVLDGETVSDAYMIEYDGAGKTIVEVGILFGAGTPTIESKSEIFKSQRGDNHGQFAAKPTNSAHTARGYMIYKEDGSYKVIYSE